MPKLMEVAAGVYRAVVPEAVRDWPLTHWLKWQVLGHDLIYDENYFATKVEVPAAQAAGVIASSIVAEFAPRSVIDVGCGTGALLEALREHGCDTSGLEHARPALKFCRKRGLSVRRFDLENDNLADDRVYDVAISMEVAEHLPAPSADKFVDLLVRLGRRAIVFTAAIPGQGGHDHVNEQPHEYWISKFAQRGFELDMPRSDRWRDAWVTSGLVAHWYSGNLMIFLPCESRRVTQTGIPAPTVLMRNGSSGRTPN